MDLGEKSLVELIAKILEEGKTVVTLYRKYVDIPVFHFYRQLNEV